MKLEQINPNHVDSPMFRADKLRNVGNWSFYDFLSEDAIQCRMVIHHGTRMSLFTQQDWGWAFVPESIGWGSASDQQGMQKLMPSGWRYRRNGGCPRYELNGVLQEII
jgi:hypothetical protein